MVQLSFLDVDKRLAALSKQGDPLEAIARLVPWEEFRAEIGEGVLERVEVGTVSQSFDGADLTTDRIDCQR